MRETRKNWIETHSHYQAELYCQEEDWEESQEFELEEADKPDAPDEGCPFDPEDPWGDGIIEN